MGVEEYLALRLEPLAERAIVLTFYHSLRFIAHSVKSHSFK
jgi:hypothetical protein